MRSMYSTPSLSRLCSTLLMVFSLVKSNMLPTSCSYLPTLVAR